MEQYKIFWTVIKIVAVLFIFVFLFYPILNMVKISFMDPDTGKFTFKNYTVYFTSKYYSQALMNSLTIGVISTALIMLLTLPLAYYLTHYRVPGASIFNTIIWIPYLMPAFIGAYSWILLFGRMGLITKFFIKHLGVRPWTIRGYWGMVIVFVLSYFPLAYILLKGAFETIDPDIEEAAATMGAGKVRRFFTVILPAITPALLNTTLMIFILVIDSFGIPAIIGFETPMLTTRVFGEFTSEMGGIPSRANSGAIILLLISISILLVQRFYIQRKSYAMAVVRRITPEEMGKVQKTFVLILLSFFLAVSIIPTAGIVLVSFTKSVGPVLKFGHFSLQNYRDIMYAIPDALKNSYYFAAVAMVIDVILGLFVAYVIVRNFGRFNAFVDAVTMIPLSIPGIVVGIGMIMTFNTPPLVLTGTPYILILAYAVRRLPYAIRSISSVLHQIDPHIEEAAITLGEKPGKTMMKVVTRLVAPGVISAALLSWTLSVADLTTTIFLYGPFTRTLTVLGYGEMIGDSFGTASAVAVILLVSIILPIGIFNTLARKKKRKVSEHIPSSVETAEAG